MKKLTSIFSGILLVSLILSGCGKRYTTCDCADLTYELYQEYDKIIFSDMGVIKKAWAMRKAKKTLKKDMRYKFCLEQGLSPLSIEYYPYDKKIFASCESWISMEKKTDDLWEKIKDKQTWEELQHAESLKNYAEYKELGLSDVEDVFNIVETRINCDGTNSDMNQRVRTFFEINHGIIHFKNLKWTGFKDSSDFYLKFPNGSLYDFHIDGYRYENSWVKLPNEGGRKNRFMSDDKDLNILIKSLYEESIKFPIKLKDVAIM